MNKQLFWKFTFRQPVRALFLCLLIGAISFACISNALEYMVIRAETKRIGGYYRSVGYLSPHRDPMNEITDDDFLSDPTILVNTTNLVDITIGADYVVKSPLVDFDDRRRFTSGVLQGLYNADIEGTTSNRYSRISGGILIDYGIHASDLLVYGTLNNIGIYIRDTNELGEGENGYDLTFEIDTIVAGYPEFVREDMSMTVRVLPELAEGNLDWINDLQIGQRYFFRPYFDPIIGSFLRIGNLFSNWDSSTGPMLFKTAMAIRPLIGESCWFIPVEPGESVDFNDPKFSALIDEIDVLDENQRSMTVYATKDMSVMPFTLESANRYYLVDGRWLSREDDLTTQRVCVVHEIFAKLRGLSVGDSITLTLRDLHSPHYWFPNYINNIGEDWHNWREYPTYSETFEIVGTYNIKKPAREISTRDALIMYIPDSSMPPEYGSLSGYHEGYYNYSFTLLSTRDQELFISENEDALAERGFSVRFADSNANSFWQTADSLLRSKLINAIIFGVLTVLTLALSVFIYIRSRRREFAILRALGVSQNSLMLQLLIPISALGLAGIIAFGVPAWFYAMGKVTQQLTSAFNSFESGGFIAPSPIWLGIFGAGVFALLLIIIIIGMLALVRRSVIGMLTGK